MPHVSPFRLAKISALLMLGAAMTACNSREMPTLSAGTDFCTAARAIYYSRHDTPPTIKQIREHNAVGIALRCGWQPAKK